MAEEDSEVEVVFGTKGSGAQQCPSWDFSLVVGGLLQSPWSIVTHQALLVYVSPQHAQETVGKETQMAGK